MGLFVLILFLAGNCRPKHKLYKSPPGYDFSAMMETTKLDLKLREISGLAWDHMKNEFVSINDERGKIFYLDKETKAIRQTYDFAGKGDYEDIALVNGVPYILESNGTIYRFNIDSAGNTSNTEVGKLPIEGARDFETMYYDPGRKALVLLCKNCDLDNKKTVSAFAYYPDSIGFVAKPIYQIDVKAVEKLAPKSSSRLQPSAAAINPVQQKLYILSSASNELAIADLNGNVEQVFTLLKKIFTQPEGICFKQSGDMYISNEGGTGKPTLIKCTYKR
jgi:uncharacterized protein YjiK